MTECMSELKVETTELKPCPFCGGDASFYSLGKYDKEVYCGNCGTVSDIYETAQKAIEAWNRRDERTCHNYGGEEGTNGEFYDFACSACGFMCDLPDTRYCPSCGAKVAEQCHNVVLDADGVEILVGDTVYHVKDGSEMTVYGIDGEWLVVSVGGRVRHDIVTHRAPVLAADGRPLREGETVWDTKGNGPYIIDAIEGDGVVRIKGNDLDYFGADFTHERHESWERLEGDAGKNPFDYCKDVGHRLDTCENSEAYKARDLVRRAKKLAGVE